MSLIYDADVNHTGIPVTVYGILHHALLESIPQGYTGSERVVILG
jgi:hypothetical protein